MNIVSSPLQFVEVDADAVLIDSRVYCQEVIQVDHGDWIRNVLLTHQEIIEELFGVLRFENGKPLKGSLGGRPERYALLTEAQCNFALTLSRNTAKTMRKKAELIADFERAKAILRSQLEHQFTRPATPSPAGYCHTFWKVWADSGIKSVK